MPGKLGVRTGQCTLLFYIKNPSENLGFFIFGDHMTAEKSSNIHIGHCTAPHGIRGEFSFVLYNQEDSVLEAGMTVTLFPKSAESSVPQDGREYKIQSIRFGNKVITVLEGVDNRNVVEEMIPFDIYLNRDVFPDLDEGEYYINDLLGLEVFNFYTKEKIGRVMDFYDNGAQIVLKIKTEKNIFDILFLENFVPVVDLNLERIEIIPPIMVE